ncbi:MAG: hypothetical protein RR559_07245 [Bacteroides sp.]
MKNSLLIVAFFGMLLVSCNRTTPLTVQGKLSIGHEVSSFTPCGDTLTYWVDDHANHLDSLYKKAVGENAEPYAYVYAELKVTASGKRDEGFAADYDGVYKVVEIIKVEPMELHPACK